jgi:hypothetical protein
MDLEDIIKFPLDQIKKQSRHQYTEEQNDFISDCTKIIKITNKRQKWNEIAKLFQNRFLSVQPERSAKNLSDHFEHSVNKNIKRSPFSIEEDNLIYYFVCQQGHKWKIIGQILNRNENQIKNEFYRKILPNQRKIGTKGSELRPEINFSDIENSFDFDYFSCC